jgi:hypothetical protein
MRSPERILRAIAAVLALIAAGWAIRSVLRHQEDDRDLNVVLIRVGFYSFVAVGFLRRTFGARWHSWQWLLGALLFGIWLWEGRGHILTVPALAAAIGLTLTGAILEWRQAAAAQRGVAPDRALPRR